MVAQGAGPVDNKMDRLPMKRLTLMLAAVTVTLAQSDPAELVKQSREAINQGNVGSALALYADNATIDWGALCVEAPCVTTGKDKPCRVETGRNGGSTTVTTRNGGATASTTVSPGGQGSSVTVGSGSSGDSGCVITHPGK